MPDLSHLGNVSAARIGPAAMTLIDRLQHYTKEEQGAGIALAFLVLAHKLKARPMDLIHTAARILDRAPSDAPEIKALRMYVEHQL